jgi:succinate-semialdehyde dehydrogenase
MVTEPDEIERVTDAIFPDGVMNPHLVGRPATEVAEAAGILMPKDMKMIAVLARGARWEKLLAREKMFPVIALFPCNGFQEAVEIAAANLAEDGTGHSVCIHSENQDHVEYAALNLPVSRFIVNQCAATAAGGSFQNGLAATNTLGCGSWGGNSISENLTYKHLINYSRVAWCLEDRPTPTDDQIWALNVEGRDGA